MEARIHNPVSLEVAVMCDTSKPGDHLLLECVRDVGIRVVKVTPFRYLLLWQRNFESLSFDKRLLGAGWTLGGIHWFGFFYLYYLGLRGSESGREVEVGRASAI